jgi:hypothetical protein
MVTAPSNNAIFSQRFTLLEVRQFPDQSGGHENSAHSSKAAAQPIIS